MKKQLNHLRRFFARTGTRKLNAATAREVISASYDDDDSSNRLSGAFIVVLLFHVIALVGVFLLSRMKYPKAEAASASAPAADVTAAASRTAPGAAVTPAGDLEGTPVPAAALQPAAAPARQAAAPAAEPEVEAPARRQNIGRTYVVKNGDNLTKIAIAYDLSPADLIAANRLKGDEIRAGQELIIPEAKSAKTTAEMKPVAKAADKPAAVKVTPNTYTVRKNDTLVKIARELGVPYAELTKLNNIKDPRKLQEGQVLKVPKKS